MGRILGASKLAALYCCFVAAWEVLQVGFPHIPQPCIAGACRVLSLTVVPPVISSFKDSTCSLCFAIKIISVLYLSLEFTLIAGKSLQLALAGAVQWCWVLCVLVM